MGSLKQVFSFILLSAHVEVDSSLVVVVSERICAVNAALENSVSFFTFTFCMTEVKTFTGITIAQSLHVACVISIGLPSWFETEIFPVLRRNRNPPMHMYLKRRDTWKRNHIGMPHTSLCLCALRVCASTARKWQIEFCFVSSSCGFK